MANKNKNVLSVVERTNSGSSASRKARREGQVPAVLYGHGAKPKQFLLDGKEWNVLRNQDIQIVELKSGKNTLNALIKDVQYNYLKGATVHVDFLEVKMDEIITASIPIHTHGIPIGLSQGGVLDQSMHELEIECTPATLPESIDVDVTEVELDGAIHASELLLPEGIKLITDPEQMVLHVMLPRVQEEEVEEEAIEGIEGVEGAEGEEAATDASSEPASE